MNFDCPVAETSEGIEPNVKDVQLNAIAYSNWRVILMQIKQSEGFDKVSATEICVFLARRGTVTDF